MSQSKLMTMLALADNDTQDGICQVHQQEISTEQEHTIALTDIAYSSDAALAVDDTLADIIKRTINGCPQAQHYPSDSSIIQMC